MIKQFKNIKQNFSKQNSRAKKFWYTYLIFLPLFLILAIVGTVITLNYNGTILWHSYVFGVTFIFVILLGFYFLNKYHSNGDKVLWKPRTYVLFSIAIIVFQLCLGIISTHFYNYRTFSNDLVMTSSSQLFTDDTTHYDKDDKTQVIVFYKYGCPLCEKAIPTLLNNLSASQKSKVTFIDKATKKGEKLAKSFDVEYASTVVVVNGSNTTSYGLADYNDGNISINNLGMTSVIAEIERLDN